MSEEPSRRSKRVTGLLVLGALAIILIPALFDFQKDQLGSPGVGPEALDAPEDYQSRIVPLDDAELVTPDFETMFASELEQAGGGSSGEQPESPPKLNTAVDAPRLLDFDTDPPPETGGPPLRERVGLIAWVVQIGSFSTRERAMRLRDELRENSWPAFVEEVAMQEEARFRVRIGPELDRERAREIRQEIAKKKGIEGFVLRYPSQ